MTGFFNRMLGKKDSMEPLEPVAPTQENSGILQEETEVLQDTAESAPTQPETPIFMPPGHFYSPIPSVEYVKAHRDRIFTLPDSLPGIDLRAQAQFALLAELKKYYDEKPFQATKLPDLRYFYENPSYSWLDGTFLHCMLRHFKPKRIIEIGSGYTTAMMLDTRELHLHDLEITCIEPYPELLLSLLKDGDKEALKLIATDVQDVELELFDELQENDILFIDSTHVSKIGSDVNYEIFEILPRLRKGVLIHIHDAFYPFEYPYDWVLENRGWNEMYLLRGFLQFNSAFQIELFSSWLVLKHEEKIRTRMPDCLNNSGGNIWLRRV